MPTHLVQEDEEHDIVSEASKLCSQGIRTQNAKKSSTTVDSVLYIMAFMLPRSAEMTDCSP